MGITIRSDSRSLARGLGWFGAGLGVAEVLMPRTVAKAIGVSPTGSIPMLLRSMGIRELASSAAIFSEPDSAGRRFSRVAGDAVDLALLGVAIAKPDTGKKRLIIAIAAVVGVAILDVIAARSAMR